MRKIATYIILITIVLGLCACGTNTSTQPTEETSFGEIYSAGLQEDGYYIDFENKAPEYNYNLSVTEKELTEFIADSLREELDEALTFDKYLELYANDFLSAMELDRKNIVELTDAVVVNLFFTDSEGNAMPEYTQESQRYIVTEDADAIVSSFLTHKVGDQYTVNYTFPKEDEYHPEETVSVAVTIENIYYSDALHSGVVENHLTELNEVLVDVKDVETLKKALYPYVLGYHLQDYIEEKIISSEIEVPEEWISYEVDRLNNRLIAVDITREQYMAEMGFTEEDLVQSCMLIARENVIAMSEYRKYFDPLTDENLIKAYGEENLDYYIQMQGRPYLKLRLMRALVFKELALRTPVLDEEGNTIDLSLYFGEVSTENTNENKENTVPNNQ